MKNILLMVLVLLCCEYLPAFSQTEEARRVGDQILFYQRVTGGWPKNIDMAMPLSDKERAQVMVDKQKRDDSTTDNGATTSQMTFLARLYQQTKDKRYCEAFRQGVNYLLSGQYKNGGWPQFWPENRDYQVHITYNDDAMVNTMTLLRDVATQKEPYQGNLTGKALRQQMQKAFDKGIECILATQIVANGELTIWCQQHDRETLKPAAARAYELPSYCSQESAAIVRLLMELPHPDERVKRAVHAAMRWFDKHKITGYRYVRTRDRHLEADSTAAPIWARFYDLEQCEPFVCDRDGVPRRHLEEIGSERRNGYAWYNDRPAMLYPIYEAWAEKYDPINKVSISLNARRDSIFSIYHAVVAADGSGDYKTVQAAIDAVPDNNLSQYLIYIKAGTYKEHVYIPLNKSRLSLIGEGMDKVYITDNQKSGGPEAVPVDKGATVVVHANDITFQGISFVNSYGVESNNGPQALALYAKGDRIAIDHCGILSYQDTYRTSEADNGRNFLSRCLILGAVDFIYGSGNAWLEQCIIKINRKSGGWIVAPKHRPETRWGYVFNRCTLTADGNPKETTIWLGRPWHHQPQTVFLNTRSEITLPDEGWYPTMAGLPSVFAEYNTMDADGKPLDLSKRINRYYRLGEKKDTLWCTAKNVLSADEAAEYTIEKVMSGDDNWNPLHMFLPSEKPIGYVIINGRRKAVNQYGCFER